MNQNWKLLTEQIDYETYEYLGYKIKICHDETCDHPWDASDLQPPYIMGRANIRGDSKCAFAYANGFDYEHILSIAQPFFRNNAQAILDYFKIQPASNYTSLYDYCIDEYNIIDDLNYDEQLDAVEFLLDMAGVACQKFTCCGSGQRDYTEGIMYVTIETWKKWHGSNVPYDFQKAYDSLNGCIQELKSWMSGECYGFKIYNADEEMDDSCYGFIGDDPWLNGMFEYSHSCIESMVRQAEKERAESFHWQARGVTTK